ncbi:unnamed protein product [Arctogadus glacialis]
MKLTRSDQTLFRHRGRNLLPALMSPKYGRDLSHRNVIAHRFSPPLKRHPTPLDRLMILTTVVSPTPCEQSLPVSPPTGLMSDLCALPSTGGEVASENLSLFRCVGAFIGKGMSVCVVICEQDSRAYSSNSFNVSEECA